MRAGAHILQRGDVLAKTALKKTFVIWNFIPSATESGREYEKTRFMARAPIGTAKNISFKNHGRKMVIRRSFVAIDDGMETVKRTNPFGRNWIKGVYHKRMVMRGFCKSRQSLPFTSLRAICMVDGLLV